MTPLPGDRRRRLSPQDARRGILDAAIRLVASHGLDGLRIRDVASAAGINHATLLHHFDCRDKLLVALAEHVIRMLAELAQATALPTDEATARAAVLDHLEAIIARMADRPAEFELLTEVFARTGRDEAACNLALEAESGWIAYLCRLLAPLAARHGEDAVCRTAAAITLLVRGYGLSPRRDPEILRHGIRALLMEAPPA